MGCKTGLAAALWCVSLVAAAQTATPTPPPTAAEPTAVQWQLDVVSNGNTIDQFQGTTAVGQAVTATHHHETVHEVGCKRQPDARIDLARTLTVSPVAAEASGITLAIDAQETIEDETVQRTPDGCALPPQPRRVAANHPGLVVAPGQWTNWTIVEAHPTLVYRVRASVASH